MDRQPVADYNVARRFCGYESVVEKIRKNGGSAYEVAPFIDPFPNSFDKICEQIRNLCKQPGKKYVYGYWNEPDSIMHEKGCYSTEAKQTIQTLESQVQSLCKELNNSLVIVTADHGQVNTKGVTLANYPCITECLASMPSIEAKALNLFVEEDKRKQFEQEFQKEFGDKFLLWTKELALDNKAFGIGNEHPNFQDMLGDYLAIATDDLAIYCVEEKAKSIIGAHAGLAEDKMIIPLIVVES